MTYGAGASKPTGASTPKTSSGGFVYGGIGKPKTLQTAAGKDLSAFKIGVRVRHPKFGEGTIVNVHGVGTNMSVDVAFEGGLGIKSLSANLAPLTIM